MNRGGPGDDPRRCGITPAPRKPFDARAVRGALRRELGRPLESDQWRGGHGYR